MNKDNQIKRIKELISEDTLYGKLVDREILNEHGGTKSVIDDILKLFEKAKVQLKSAKLPEIKKDFISNIVTSPKGIAKKTDVDKLKNYLDAGIKDNIYDDLATEIKAKLKPLENIKTTLYDTSDNLITSSIYDQLSKSIDESISKAKKDNIYKDFGADDISTSFDELIPGISNSYKIGKKANFLFNFNMKPVQDFLIKELKLFTANIWDGNSEKVFDALFRKKHKWHQKHIFRLFHTEYQLFGGKKTFIRLVGLSFAKAGFMALFCPKTTGKIKLEQKVLKISESQYRNLLLFEQGDTKFDKQQNQKNRELEKNNKGEFKMDYNKLKSNPTPEYIAAVIKNSKGGMLGNDKEAWAQSAFESIKNQETYNKVQEFLGGNDPYEFVKSFMDTDEDYHNNGNTIDKLYDKINILKGYEEELSTAGKTSRELAFGLAALIKTVHPESYINPFGSLADLDTKYFGGKLDWLRFLDLTDFNCELKEEYEEAKNLVLDYHPDIKQSYEDGIGEVTESFNTKLNSLNQDSIKFIQKTAEEKGIKNLTPEDVENFLKRGKDSTGNN